MDLRKGTDVKEGTRRCIRCSGRKKMYQVGKTGCWTHHNSGGVLKDCPLCLGKGTIDKIPPKIEESTPDIEENTNGKKRRKPRKAKAAKEHIQTEFDKEY